LSIVSNNSGPFPQLVLTDTANGVSLNITTSNITYTPGSVAQFSLDIPSTLVGGHILPNTTNVYDLGSADLQWRDIHLSSGSIYMSTSKISLAEDGNLQLQIGGASNFKIPTTNTPVSSFGYLEADRSYISSLTASSITAVNFIYLSSVQDSYYISTTNLDAEEITFSTLYGQRASTQSLEVSSINGINTSDYLKNT
jgi:hypothetical protein